MTWTPVTNTEMKIARNVVRWIETARSAGYPIDWLPSDADVSKSALLERLRSGKEPLGEPPPLGLSCPWYAVVEDPGPHYVFEVYEDKDTVAVLQNLYKIVRRFSEHKFIIRDGRRDTSYRFSLWYDADWRHPSGRIVGGWFMQNAAFSVHTPIIVNPKD